MSFFHTVSDGVRGVLFALSAIFLVSLQDVIIKILSSSQMPLHQLLVFRYGIGLVLFGWLVVFVSSYDGLKTRHLKKQLGRGLLVFLSSICYYLALAVMPVAETVAIFFSAPLFVTVLSVFILGEHVGPHRWTATVIGFIGVLVMVRPGGDVFNPMTVLVLFAAVCYALAMLLARKMGASESAVSMSFYAMIANLGGALTMSIFVHAGFLKALEPYSHFRFLTNSWINPDSFSILLVAMVALITVVSFHLITQAYRIAPPSLLALFEYSTMFWAILWGMMFFNQYPDGWTLAGVVLVVCAGAYTIARESWKPRTRERKWFTGRALSRYR